MFSNVFLVLFLGLALLSSVARGLPSLPARDKNPSSCSASNDSSNKGKDNGKSTNNNKGGNNNDPQKSLTLDPKVLAKGFEQNGQENQTAGQVASLTSSNNFINFCLTSNKPLTNGQQIKSGSCNPCPMGDIPDTKHMPFSKFTSPKNFGVVKANTNFTIDMKIKNLQTGNFVNADNNYYSAPQQLDKTGQIVGHSHFVVQPVDSFTSTKPLDPTKFTFFKGVNTPAKNDIVSVSVDQGLPEGQYRLASINTAANHQPVLAPVAQHGFLDDVIYFSVTKDGKSSTSSGDAASQKKQSKNKSADNGDKNKNKDKTKTADPSSCNAGKN